MKHIIILITIFLLGSLLWAEGEHDGRNTLHVSGVYSGSLDDFVDANHDGIHDKTGEVLDMDGNRKNDVTGRYYEVDNDEDWDDDHHEDNSRGEHHGYGDFDD